MSWSLDVVGFGFGFACRIAFIYDYFDGGAVYSSIEPSNLDRYDFYTEFIDTSLVVVVFFYLISRWVV